MRLCFLILCFFAVSGFSNQPVDSLRNVYFSLENDSAKIAFILEKIGYAFETVNADSAFYYYRIADNIARKNAKQSEFYRNAIGDIYRSRSAVYQSQGNFVQSRKMLDSAASVYTQTGNKRALARTYVDFGINDYYQGFYTEAIQNYLKAIDIFGELGLKKPIATTYNNIALVQVAQKRIEEALETYFKALQVVLETNDERAISYFYNNIGSGYLKLGKTNEALEYFQKSLEVLKKLGEKNSIALTYSNIASVHQQAGNKQQALFFLEQSLKLAEETGNQVSIVSVRTTMASIYLDLSQAREISEQTRTKYLQTAIINAENALEMAKKANLLPDINRTAQILFKSYKQLKNHETALQYAELYITTQDSLLRSEKNKSLEELMVRHENEKLLKQQQLDKEIIRRQEEVTAKQRIIIFISLLALLITGILAVLVVRNYRQKQQAYNEIERKNFLLERANQEILNQHEELKQTNSQLHQANEEIRAQRDYLSELNEELNQKNQQLEQTQAKLVESEKMASLGVLTAGIAHEINNPINFVFAGANCLMRDFNDIKSVIDKLKELKSDAADLEKISAEILRQYDDLGIDETIGAIDQTIKDIHLGAVRAAEIVAGLKNFSRAETSEWIQYDVNKAIDGVLILLKNNYKNRIEIVKDLQPNLPIIDCLGGKINQVIMNLVSNAIDAIDGEGKIFITTRKIEDNIELSVRDTGVGIPESIINKIFDPFYTTKPVGKGTGLGLSITYGIIQEHNGTLDVKSKVGEGSQFIVRIPIRRHQS